MERLKVIDTSESSFRGTIQSGKMYIDKTAMLYRLITSGKLYFLSRPRRFGKTLTVSTLESIFQGEKELFKGLFIDSADYDWKKYPVIHIDFGDCPEDTAQGLDGWLSRKMGKIASDYGIALTDGVKSAERFSALIDCLSSESQVVILVDEYEKVLSDHLFSPHVEALRDVLGNFYQVIKTKGDVIRFAFLTGVTKYAKMSVFSRMNNLTDISMDPAYGTMLGYTQKELLEYFGGYIDLGVKKTGMPRDEYLSVVKEKYNGYVFAPSSKSVYNPVSIGQLFAQGQGWLFRNYWMDTGGMGLVTDMARRIDLDVTRDLDEPMNETSLSTFDITAFGKGNVSKEQVKSLLLQTGYLTIKGWDGGVRKPLSYRLGFPNLEVQDAFCQILLQTYSKETNGSVLLSMVDSLEKGETEGFVGKLKALFASIPYRTDGHEADWQAVMSLLFTLYKPSMVQTEMHTAEGRIDMVLRTERHLYVIELKVGKDADEALAQIRDRRYADRFLMEKDIRVHLLGIGFGQEHHRLESWKEEIL